MYQMIRLCQNGFRLELQFANESIPLNRCEQSSKLDSTLHLIFKTRYKCVTTVIFVRSRSIINRHARKKFRMIGDVVVNINY